MTAPNITRRCALRSLALGTAAAAGATLLTGGTGGQAEKPQVTVRLDDTVGTIRPALYGHFAEHIGGVIYDGVWVGPKSKVRNIDGIRSALVEHVRRLGRVVVRWPGGCFADKYHWRDGIGPRDKRPRRYGRWRDVTEANQFGTQEFMRFCRLCNVEPYFAANVGTGSAEEFQDWVEYCNAPAGATTLADERVANGDRRPLGIRYWGVGNESWGCGGKFTPEDYCTEYRKFTEWLPAYGVPLYLIASGPDGSNFTTALDWTRRFFRKRTDFARAPLQGWAAHYYCGTTGHALRFSHDQWYEMLDKANRMEQLITEQWSAMADFDPKHEVKLVIDEWGAWHPPGTEINRRHLFEQMGCLRDALVAALTLDTFNRHADKVAMANIAQLVNNLHSLFLADGDRFVATPTYHVFEMYRPHHGGRSVRLDVQVPRVTFRKEGKEHPLFRVAGSASVQKRLLTVTLVHTHVREPIEVALRLRGGAGEVVRQTVLTHEELNGHNTFDRPNVVMPKPADVAERARDPRVVLPPASVNRVDVQLR
jgi:alpha-N-arabinofuranosidase